MKKARWKVDVVWRLGTTIEVEAESAEDAEQMVYALNLSEFDGDAEYLDDSLLVVDVQACE